MKTIPLAFLILSFFSGLVCAENKPSILFEIPHENRYAFVGFDYMRQLAAAGFAVDYVENTKEFTWDRVKNYNVVVVLDFPGANLEMNAFTQFPPADAGMLDDYFAVLEKFRAAGGGILIHYTPSTGGGAPNALLKQWGIQFPLIALRDTNTDHLTNLGDVNSCAFTDQVLPSPVSEGVHQIWYPIDGPHYTSWHTMPVLIDSTWQPVVKASKSAWTEIPKYDLAGFQPAPGALIPTEPIKDPILFAIRDGTGTEGRLAAIQTWHQFSIGSGMKWLFNNEVLEKGLGTHPSQYGRLLLNTYHWLAEPSLKSGAVGGYVQDPTRLLEPQAKPDAFKQFAEIVYKPGEGESGPQGGKLFKGLIGAQTALSGGQGSVEDYAKAASEAGLDYLAILEDFSQMTPEKLEQLKEAVKKASTPTLRIFAGYRIKNNVGNNMFIYGLNPPWPSAHLLVGEHHDIYNLQYQNEQGKFVQAGSPLDWLLGLPALDCTAGYYDFSHSGKGALQIHELRPYSSAAIRTYEGGKLVDDAAQDYMLTWQSTLGSVPLSMDIVKSPKELKDAVTKHEALTYAHANSLDKLWEQALRWNGPYDGPNVFVSDGPIVERWPKTMRSCTFGAEPFVPGRSLQVAPIDVTSDVGLKEISLYDGQNLFRRFLCQGAKEFKQDLLFPAVVHRSIVMVAEDVKGGKAVTYPVTNYKEGTRGPVFCSDHVNDCSSMLLGRGPVWTKFPWTPVIPDAGNTWDGGPLALRQLLTIGQTWPVLETEPKTLEWSGACLPYQTPLLEFADEGATRCRMVSEKKIIDALAPLGLNPWSGYGPTEPNTLADAWSSHTVFGQYVTGVDTMAWGAPGFERGAIACLFTQQIKFKADAVINRCLLLNGWWRSPKLPASVQFVVGRGGQILDTMDISIDPDAEHSFRVETGDWFALYSGLPSNTALVINRGPAVTVRFSPHGNYWMRVYADFEKKVFKPGETYDTEFFGMTWPMDEKMITAGSIAQVVTYLANPTGLELTRGKRVTGAGGLLELSPEKGAVELSIPKPSMPVVVPLRVGGFNKRWSVGLYQSEGYRTHYYSKSNSGYRALGLDFDGRAYIPMFVQMAPVTHDLIGHPVTADDSGKDLFIQVTCLSRDEATGAMTWHVSVNNPTDHPVETSLHKAMDLPGFTFADQKIKLQPGEYRVLDSTAAPAK